MHIYLLKGLYQSHNKQETTQVMEMKKVVFKNCAPFTDYISELNNTQIDNAKDIHVVMPVHNLII